jgi:sirohydrochlorin cobaltochelatase
MAHPLDALLTDWLANDDLRIGEVVASRVDDRFEVRHRDDGDRDDSHEHGRSDDAAEIARFDDAGNFRPLKSAPNLRHGWRLVVSPITELRVAIDLLYPARLAAFFQLQNEALATTPLRRTLNRQSGLYRVAANITDEQINDLVARFCQSDGGCLKTILWPRDENGTTASTKLSPEKFEPAHDQTGRGARVMPLLCQEACNLLVAEARKVVKGEA